MDEEDVRVADALYSMPGFKGQLLAQTRGAAQKSLAIPSSHIQKILMDQEVFDPETFVQVPKHF